MKVSLIQMESLSDKQANLDAAQRLVAEAVDRDRPELVVFPEHFAFREYDPDRRRAGAEPVGEGVTFEALKAMAVRHGLWVHGGSFCEDADGRYHNTTMVLDPKGEIRAVYRKIHMFDITGSDGTIHRESAFTTPGQDIVTYDVGDLRVGCTVCYDLRFPELFQALVRRGAKVIVVPACFTMLTGKDHWEPLLRARAIDTQCYILASAQAGRIEDGSRPSYGNSMIVDPWGTVVARARDGEGVVSGYLDFGYQDLVRSRIPVADHHRLLDK